MKLCFLPLTLPFSLLDHTDLLVELEKGFMDIAETKVLTAETRDHLLSLGEHMSTIIFSTYLNKLGDRARQVHTSSKCNTLVVG